MIGRDDILAAAPRRPVSAAGLFLRRFLAQPRRLASVMASSAALGRLVAREVRREPDEVVLELGAGTGAITQALLEAGIPPDKLIAVEIDAELAAFLRRRFPALAVLEADAFDLPKALPPAAAGRIGAVICGLPVSLLPREEQRDLMAKMLSLLPPSRGVLAYSHRLTSPLPAAELGLVGERLAFTLRNLPPASVWGFRALDSESGES